jgi:predicted ATP-grasp superfamily ATP-dependent carboligase
MNVLITDGENRSALAVTRSLGRKGCRVVVTGRGFPNLSASSKFCRKAYRVLDPLQNHREYAESIIEVVKKEKIDIIFPITEPSIYLLNHSREKLPPNVILACSDTDKMAAVSNKIALFQLAEKLHVPIPRTIYLSGPGDLCHCISDIDHFPVVIKPAFSRILGEGGFLVGKVCYANSKKDLIEIYARNRSLLYPSMIQEKIIGPGTGLFTLYDIDRHLVLFSHRRLKEKPPWGGVSVVSESVLLDEKMIDDAGKLLSAVNWSGVAMVEFKRDLRDGQAKLIEINGRFWGSLKLAIECGIDFPSLYFDYLLGNCKSFPVRDFKIGHKLKWFLGTLDHLLILIKQRRNEFDFSINSEVKVKAMKDFFKIWEKNTSFDVFDKKDPLPFFIEAQSYLQEALKIK